MLYIVCSIIQEAVGMWFLLLLYENNYFSWCMTRIFDLRKGGLYTRLFILPPCKRNFSGIETHTSATSMRLQHLHLGFMTI